MPYSCEWKYLEQTGSNYSRDSEVGVAVEVWLNICDTRECIFVFPSIPICFGIDWKALSSSYMHIPFVHFSNGT